MRNRIKSILREVLMKGDEVKPDMRYYRFIDNNYAFGKNLWDDEETENEAWEINKRIEYDENPDREMIDLLFKKVDKEGKHDEVVKKILRKLSQRDRDSLYPEEKLYLKKIDQSVIENYIKSRMDDNTAISSVELMKMASQNIIDEYVISRFLKDNRDLTVYHFFMASGSAKDHMLKKLIEKEKRHPLLEMVLDMPTTERSQESIKLSKSFDKLFNSLKEMGALKKPPEFYSASQEMINKYIEKMVELGLMNQDMVNKEIEKELGVDDEEFLNQFKDKDKEKETVTYDILFRGKTKSTIELSADLSKEEVKEKVMSLDKVKDVLKNEYDVEEPDRIIVVPNKMVNIIPYPNE